MHPERIFLLAAAITVIPASSLLSGCGGDGTSEPRSHSAKARVVPKSGEVWGRDLANGLALQEWELCRELGQLDCVSEAHRITLGGVEPARLGIDEPLEITPVSAPIAVDRVALSACSTRYERDLEGPAVVFGPALTLSSDSELERAAAHEVVAQNLVRRLLSRDATDDEVQALLDLYDKLDGTSTDVVRDWSVGACMVVATSTEALFY